jgi:hypothetical protein
MHDRAAVEFSHAASEPRSSQCDHFSCHKMKLDLRWFIMHLSKYKLFYFIKIGLIFDLVMSVSSFVS